MSSLELFESLVDLYDAPSPPPSPYDGLGLVKLCCKHAVPGGSQSIAEAALTHAGLDISGPVDQKAILSAAELFAGHLIDNLFLPLRAIAQCRSLIEDADSSIDSFDENSVQAPADGAQPQTLYIFPPSPMTQIDEDGDQSESGYLAASLLSILSLDEDTVQHMQQCQYTDSNKVNIRPRDDNNNGSHDWPALFSHLQAVVDLERTPPALRRVDMSSAADSSAIDTATVDRRLLSLHAKIAHILAGSGADKYINTILEGTSLEDMDSAGGTSHLGRLMTLRLEGWWDGGRKKGGATESVFWIESSNFIEN